MDEEVFDRTFDQIDANGDGTIDAQEILRLISIFGKKIDKARFWKVFNESDVDSSGTIDRDEFKNLMINLTETSRKRSAKRYLAMKAKLKDGAKNAGHTKLEEHKKEEATRKREQGKLGYKPPAGGEPHIRHGKQPDGSSWMTEMTDQFRTLSEVYKSRKRWADRAVRAKLLVLPRDPRMRTNMGRQLLHQERLGVLKAETRRLEQEKAEEAMNSLDAFSNLFGKGPQ